VQSIAEGLFTDDRSPRLIGGRDPVTGRILFPRPLRDDSEPVALGETGKLWSWTVQRYRPKSPPYAGPETFTPWIVGYVELPGEVIVEARLVDVAIEDVRIGMTLRLMPVLLDPADPASPLIPAFAPMEASV